MGALLATALPLVLQYGPTVLSLVEQFGPQVESAVVPLIEASAKAGTLSADAGKLIAAVQQLAPMLGEITSLADLADALGSIGPATGAAVEDPAMAKAAGPAHGGR